MWSGSKIYFFRSRRQTSGSICGRSIWNDRFKQVTFFKDYDVHFPASDLAKSFFENAGRLHLLDLKQKDPRGGNLRHHGSLHPRNRGSKMFPASSNGPPPLPANAPILCARRHILHPAEHGVVRNLTRSSGVAGRLPAWSPDGKLIAYWMIVRGI